MNPKVRTGVILPLVLFRGIILVSHFPFCAPGHNFISASHCQDPTRGAAAHAISNPRPEYMRKRRSLFKEHLESFRQSLTAALTALSRRRELSPHPLGKGSYRSIFPGCKRRGLLCFEVSLLSLYNNYYMVDAPYNSRGSEIVLRSPPQA